MPSGSNRASNARVRAQEDENGHTTLVAQYIGRDEPGTATKPGRSDMMRGCIIGGTALVDAHVKGRPYPNRVVLTSRTKYLAWRTDELRQAMRDDKSIEAAVLSTLYLDLVRARGHAHAHAQSRMAMGMGEGVHVSTCCACTWA